MSLMRKPSATELENRRKVNLDAQLDAVRKNITAQRERMEYLKHRFKDEPEHKDIEQGRQKLNKFRSEERRLRNAIKGL